MIHIFFCHLLTKYAHSCTHTWQKMMILTYLTRTALRKACHIVDKIINSPLDLFYFRKFWNRGLSIPPILFRSEGTKNVGTQSSVFQACNCVFRKEQKWRNFYFIIFFLLNYWSERKKNHCYAWHFCLLIHKRKLCWIFFSEWKLANL